ncbi:MAG: SPOR domain-containing protein, partial [Bacteriovoracaceae bacterium]
QNEAKPSEIGIEKPAISAPVRPAPVVEEKSEPAAAVSGDFVVQVGVYSQESKAYEQAQNFSSSIGRQAIVFTKQSGGKTVYAVAFNGFEDDRTAKVFGGELKAKFNIDWFVVKR